MSQNTVHDRISVNSICLLDFNYPKQAECWRELNAKRISLVGPQMDEEGNDAARAAVATGDYQLETIVHPFLPGQDLNADPTSWSKPRDALSARIQLAKDWGAKSIYMTTGGHGGMLWEEAAEVFCEMVAPCTKKARESGIALMIENAPPQYADIHIAHTLRDTITLAEQAGIGICIDLFSCWTEPELEKNIRRATAISQLVQVSDYVLGDRMLPARAVPGDGVMPLKQLLHWILDAGYQGVFDLELLGPRIQQDGNVAATRRAIATTSQLLNELGV